MPICTVRSSLSDLFSAGHLFQIVQIFKGLVPWIWCDSISSNLDRNVTEKQAH